MNKIKVRNIFAAVSDKSILDPLLEVLQKVRPSIRSDLKSDLRFWGTEGTVKYLKLKGFTAQSVVSGFDFGGRVKTLQREVFVRILADKANSKHLNELKKLKLTSFDLVIVDLYPSNKKNFPESMDIGGQALIRAAIKNYKNVALIYDLESLENFVNHLKANQANQGSTLLEFRKRQAKTALKFIAERCELESRLWNMRSISAKL